MFLRPDQMPRTAEQVSFSSAVPVLSTAQNVKSALEDLAQSLSDASNLELTEPLPEPHETAQTVQEALVSLASTGPAQVTSNVAPVTQPSHGFVVGTQIRPTSSGWVRAQGNTIANASNVWTTVSVNGDDFTAVKEGRVYLPSHGLGSANTLLYLSPGNAPLPGALVSTKPVGTNTVPLGFYLPVIWIEDSNYIHVLGKPYPEIDPVLAIFQPSSDTSTTVSFPVSPLLYSNGEFTLEFQASWVSNNAGSSLRSGPTLSLTAGTITTVEIFGSDFLDTGNTFTKYSGLSDFFRYYDITGTKIFGEAKFKIRRQSTSWLTLVEGYTHNTANSFSGPIFSKSDGFVLSSATPSNVSVALTSQNFDDYFRLFSSSSDFVRLLWKGPA